MKVITILCWFVVAAILIGLAGWFLTGTMFGARSERWNKIMPLSFNIGRMEVLTGPYEPVGTYDISTAGINSIRVDWIAGNIDIRTYDGDQVKVTEFAQRELRDDEKLSFAISNDTLAIRFRERNLGNILNMPQKKLEVLIPRGLGESLDKLNVDSTSSRVDVQGLSAAAIRAESISGSVNLSNIISGTLYASSTSGSITITDIRADDIEIDSLSGTVRVSGAFTQKLDCETTSGGINVSGEFGDARLASISGRISLDNSAEQSTLKTDTTSGSQELWGSFDIAKVESLSGSISIRSRSVPSSLKADSTSGSITVAIPNAGPITVYHDSTSGRFSSDVPVVLQGRGAQFELSTLSGRTRIIALD